MPMTQFTHVAAGLPSAHDIKIERARTVLNYRLACLRSRSNHHRDFRTYSA